MCEWELGKNRTKDADSVLQRKELRRYWNIQGRVQSSRGLFTPTAAEQTHPPIL